MAGLRDSKKEPIQEGFYYEGSMENQCFVSTASTSDRAFVTRHYLLQNTEELTAVSSKRLTPIGPEYVAAQLTNLARIQERLSHDLADFLSPKTA